MRRIERLPDHLVSQIAAGEVVERPASVVKELVENAIDAGATDIRLELEGGGKRKIRVMDNGSGMDSADAKLAFDRHATSKIRSFDDLQQVSTLGFRGEALSSIAAVARVELLTAEDNGEASRVRVESSRVTLCEVDARRRGTTIEVENLFSNVPARRKFMKRSATELRHCVAVLQGYALARQEIRFSLSHEGRELLSTVAVGAGESGLRERIGQIFGTTFVPHLTEIEAADSSGDGRLSGFVGNQETTRGRRLFIFVNRRLIRDRAILAIFYRAVRNEWKSDQFPALFLFLDVPTTSVDVNVHPQKAEVRFRDSSLMGRISRSLTAALRSLRRDEPAPLEALAPNTPRPTVAWRGLGAEGSPGWAWPSASAGTVAEGREDGTDGAYQRKVAEVSYRPAVRAPVALSGRGESPQSLRLLGQYKGTLLLLEGPDGLYLIDQHVAHERILYERFRAALNGRSTASQTVLSPLLLDVSASESALLLEHADELERCGFSIREMSGNSIALTALPAVLDTDGAERLLMRWIDRGADDAESTLDLREELLSSLAASQSCRVAVKMHHPLNPTEMEALVSELFECDQPFACPHGRPILLKMSDADLEKRFGRR